MTLSEAVARIESKFITHRDVGFSVPMQDQQDKTTDIGAVDMDRAPNGERYVLLTSNGVKRPGEALKVYFTDEDTAARWWYYSVLDYAETVAPEDEWPTLNLWWRDQPHYSSADYLALQQSLLLQTKHPMGVALTVTMGAVFSRLLISKEA